METIVLDDREKLDRAVADAATQLLRDTLKAKGHADVILHAGVGMEGVLEALAAAEGVGWHRVNFFMSGEFVGMENACREFFERHFLSRLPLPPGNFYLVTRVEMEQLNWSVVRRVIDLALCGVAAAGALNFNNPPGDFYSDRPYFETALTPEFRRQLASAGWFPEAAAAPETAMSMGMMQLMKSEQVIARVADDERAATLAKIVRKRIDPACPATILAGHPECRIFTF